MTTPVFVLFHEGCALLPTVVHRWRWAAVPAEAKTKALTPRLHTRTRTNSGWLSPEKGRKGRIDANAPPKSRTAGRELNVGHALFGLQTLQFS